MRYIERQDTKIAAGDKIEVKGSRITYQGKPAIVAANVHEGDEVLMLRDAKMASRMLHVEHLSLSVGDRQVFHDVNLMMARRGYNL